MNKTNQAILLLADGTYFLGNVFGARGTTTGEICFNTGMTGYQEIFTDPSYFGQIIIMNTAHVGNYGVSDNDVESNSIKINGLISSNLEENYSRIKASESLKTYLEKNNIVCISGIDTRALVAYIRNKGAMNCLISTEETNIEVLKKKLASIPSMSGLELASQVSTKESYEIGNSNAPIRIAVMDFGIKKNIIHCLIERGAFLKIFSAKTSFEEIQKFNPTGYFISNGPGDPAAMPYAVDIIKQMLHTKKPLFGICLGHQLLALAIGIETFKMHYGHRGLNHPVKNLLTQKSEITSQNHGFGILPESVLKNKSVEVTHINLNDKSIEGIRLKNTNAFSVQFHPESSPGPNDSRYLFDDFMVMMR